MRFQLDGEFHEVDPDVARARILSSIPDPVHTHWVEIDGRRWPAKQAFEVVTGIPRGTYISHTAVRLLARQGNHSPAPDTPLASTIYPSQSHISRCRSRGRETSGRSSVPVVSAVRAVIATQWEHQSHKRRLERTSSEGSPCLRDRSRANGVATISARSGSEKHPWICRV